MKYILGIDTTFHSCGVGLLDQNGKVLINKKADIDFGNEDAKKFFNFHNTNALSLLKPILKEYGEDIFLVSASSLDGPFHSMPVGAIIANSIGYLFGKEIVGVDHEVAHMHANWLDRDESDFSFPIACLNVSGGHSNIYLVKSHWEVEKISEITWRTDPEKFGGLGALFDVICELLGVEIKKGGGGAVLEKMAGLGDPAYLDAINGLKIISQDENFHFENMETGITEALKELKYESLSGSALGKFRVDFSSSLLQIIFASLVETMGQVVKETGAKEIHLVGGVALNKILSFKLADFCACSGLNFKIPLKPEYCIDNAVMVAMSGYLKWKYGKKEKKRDFLDINPAEWYYKRYAKRFE